MPLPQPLSQLWERGKRKDLFFLYLLKIIIKKNMKSYQFPNNFQWGVATASYQIEGAVATDGRKPSVWDTFSATPGRTVNGDTGAIACDHYHRFQDDVKLMAELGVKHYRFSIAWPRIIPDGRGAVNEQGIDFYKRLVDTLRQYDITPHATLFHWDSPQALEDLYGTWQNRQIAVDFAEYVTAVVKRLGDRITNWMTINEIPCFTHLGYGVNTIPPHAPGVTVATAKAVWQTSHHALLAHGLGVQAIRANSPVPCSVALVDNFAVTVPISESPANIQANALAFPFCGQNGGIIYPALTGEYHPGFLEYLGENAPDIQPGDLEIIHQPLDLLGLNIYSATYVQASDNQAGWEFLPLPSNYPKMYMPWLNLVPDALYWAARHVQETLGQNLPMIVTENGCAAPDQLTTNNQVIDSDRIMFLREYLRAVHRAIDEGYDIQGYFLWTLMDNFEWSWGYDRRFGIIYTDFATQQRLPKSSYYWLQECIRQNRVV